jgi:hypothetical protein
MEDEIDKTKLTHYQRYKECIYNSVKKNRAKKKVQKMLENQNDTLKAYNDLIIQQYLAKQQN